MWIVRHSGGRDEPGKTGSSGRNFDTTFSLWHTAVFSNDGKKVVFTDEWGGGTGPMCQATSMMQQGGNTTLEITPERKFKQGGYFKPNFSQTAQENCVSHNGGLIPVPGRDIMTQGWYQGGIDIIDFTDPMKPVEIGFFDRGPIDNPPPIDQGPPTTPAAGGRGAQARSTTGGSWARTTGTVTSTRRNRAWSGYRRTDANRQPFRERNRRVQTGSLRIVQPTEPAEDRVAGRVPRCPLVR